MNNRNLLRTNLPSTPAACAAILRHTLRLPGLKVSTRRSVVTVTWVDGPPWHVVDAHVPGPWPVCHTRLIRLYRPATFGAAMLLPQHRDLEPWARGNAALQDLHQRDLTTNPLPDNLLTQGRVLAGIIGVPPNARLGLHRARWEGDMCLKIDEVGPDTLAAVAC